ncbi:MAG: hypothetical protein CM15mP109_04340 [Candidatus Dadabacteria bacterium]|nr:MAG: hypothetical protein CM15mP109_04340 [Candidatus Dadabacteria bacterium]
MLNKSGNQLSLMMNIDTDMIIPKQFLKTIKRSGLGKNLFDEMRYDMNGNEIESFILNKDPFTKAKILIAGKILVVALAGSMLHGLYWILV